MPSSVKKLAFIFGTRPEAIKLAPVIKAFREHGGFSVKVVVTAQHRQMLDQVLSFFSIVPDHDLQLMQPGQSLSELTAAVVRRLDPVLSLEAPDLVLVQGDTTTAFAAALSAYYHQIPVAHIEAGLRSHDKYAPFPEEINRVLTAQLADIHYAPTRSAADDLLREGITAPIEVVGNSVIDALLLGRELLNGPDGAVAERQLESLPTREDFVLITGHRRESFGLPMEAICQAIAKAAGHFPSVSFIYPVHLNPKVQEPVRRLLGGLSNVHLVEPMDYPAFVLLMDRCRLVLTDSGGIQEEAPALGKPVLVMRDVTERKEGVEAGTARLVGTNEEEIFRSLKELLTDDRVYSRMAQAVNPYGDGHTSGRIVSSVAAFLEVDKRKSA